MEKSTVGEGVRRVRCDCPPTVPPLVATTWEGCGDGTGSSGGEPCSPAATVDSLPVRITRWRCGTAPASPGSSPTPNCSARSLLPATSNGRRRQKRCALLLMRPPRTAPSTRSWWWDAMTTSTSRATQSAHPVNAVALYGLCHYCWGEVLASHCPVPQATAGSPNHRGTALESRNPH